MAFPKFKVLTHWNVGTELELNTCKYMKHIFFLSLELTLKNYRGTLSVKICSEGLDCFRIADLVVEKVTDSMAMLLAAS